MPVQRQHYREGAEGAPLVVILHGLAKGPKAVESVAAAVREAIPGAGIYIPRLPFRNPFSIAAPGSIAGALLSEIDELMADGRYPKLILVGHSMGSVIARKIVVLAHGETSHAVFESDVAGCADAKPWAGRIERLVLLSGMSRGWSTTAAHDWVTATVWSILCFIGDVLLNGRWTALQVRLGSPFMVQTRLQWLALTRDRDTPITVVQLLGSRDDTVAPDDTTDFAVDVENRAFVLVDLPNTDHGAAIVMNGSASADERRSRFQAALTKTVEALRASDITIPMVLAANGPPPAADASVDDVVFVIHGIRDRGFWTQKVARTVMSEARKAGRNARAMTLSYGYLAMGPFVLPWVRRDKVRWLMDRYAECKALYPKARFQYVGHSNGTYLVARALRDYPAARFDRVVLAGSVVRSDFDWDTHVQRRGQVHQVMNYVASADWVVAIFSNAFSPLRAFDLGGAGHRGFAQLAPPAPPPGRSPVISTVAFGKELSHQIYFIRGSHGAGVQESQWDEIASFIVHGNPPAPHNSDYVGAQQSWVAASGRLPPVGLLVVAAGVLALLIGLCVLAAKLGGLGAFVVAVVLSVLLVRIVLTRF